MRQPLNFLITIMCVLGLAVFVFPAFGQVDWTKYANNPVLDIGSPGSWDDQEVAHPAILFSDSTYKMWFVGNDGTNVRIGYATSPDGINWTKYANNPVLDVGAPGEWDDLWVNGPDVLFVNGIYHLWYTGVDVSGFEGSATGYATSPDGINWTKYANNPVLTPGNTGDWDSFYASTGSVLYEAPNFIMWYLGVRNPDFTEGSTGFAQSTDGINWTKDPRNPVLTPGSPGEWDSFFVYATQVLKDGNNYHMWYHSAPFQVGYAASTDGVIWDKDPNNPVLTPGNSGEWDGVSIINPFVMLEDNQFKMWYTGVDNNNNARIGYATSVITAINSLTDVLPKGFKLAQNYPNPFNPETVIKYQLPTKSNVVLSIYNSLGQKVRTLVSQQQAAGEWSVTWKGFNDAGNSVSSGIYVYRLDAGGQTVSRKMLLLK